MKLSPLLLKVMGSEACHPDCSGTVYTTKVTSAPFRKCGAANMELSRRCSTAGIGTGEVCNASRTTKVNLVILM